MPKNITNAHCDSSTVSKKVHLLQSVTCCNRKIRALKEALIIFAAILLKHEKIRELQQLHAWQAA
jgi:hypothetical protein